MSGIGICDEKQPIVDLELLTDETTAHSDEEAVDLFRRYVDLEATEEANHRGKIPR